MGEKYHCLEHYFKNKKINSNIVVIYEIVVYIFPSLGLRPDIPFTKLKKSPR